MTSKKTVQNSKRIFITGITGQLGSTLNKYLSRYFNVLNNQENFYNIDVSDRSELKYFFKELSPDYVINCAALTNVDFCEQNKSKTHEVNVDGIKNIISCSKKSTKIIHISTDYVFNGNKKIYLESDTPDPLSYYGKAKLESENILRTSNRDFLILRTSVIFGKTGNNFYVWVRDSLRNDQKISVVTDQISNPTWSWSLSEAIYKSILSNISGLFHYAGEEVISRYDFAIKVAKVHDFNPDRIIPIKTSDLDQKAKRPLHSALDTSKIKKLIDIEHPSLDYILKIIS